LQSVLTSGATSNPTSLLDSAFVLLMQELSSTGSSIGGISSILGGMPGSGLGLSLGNI
jgi:hypothetical protein